jgi:hypothetical protein
MKTERMVLLVTPAEKADIAAKAARLGVSVSEFVRRATELFDAEDLVAMEELTQLVPELNAMADRIESRQAEWATKEAEFQRELARLRSPDYREQVRREVLTDERINWDAVGEMFGFAQPHGRAA